MSSDVYDLIVIGAGSGGVRAARIAAQLGARVAIVEGRFFGGTCVNVGCVPKKMFSYAAGFPGLFDLAGDYGFSSATSGDQDWSTLKANKDKEIARLNAIYRRILDDAGVTIHEGWARVVDGQSVHVGDTELKGKRILVATGGTPWVPEIEGREHIRISDDLFSLEALPKRVAVVGGGYIATEFASILNGLGCETTLIYRGDLFLRGFDHDVRQFVASEMAHRGVNLEFGNNIRAIQRSEQGLSLSMQEGADLAVDEVFYATGRLPNVDGLFEGIIPDMATNGAIVVDEQFQTSIPNVYALGDVIDRIQLTPVALAEGMWLARQLFAPAQAGPAPEYEFIPTAVFCHPNVGTVGLSQEQALEKHGTIRVYKSEFRALKYSLGSIVHRSMMKLIVDDATDQVVGLHVVGDDAGEIVQGFAVAVRMGATKADFDRTIGIHPTSAEELVTLRDGELVTG